MPRVSGPSQRSDPPTACLGFWLDNGKVGEAIDKILPIALAGLGYFHAAVAVKDLPGILVYSRVPNAVDRRGT